VDDGRKGRARPVSRPHLRGGGPNRRAIRGVSMTPKDFRKAAPFLGALLLAAVVFTIVRSLL
jgi:hypothetical protein